MTTFKDYISQLNSFLDKHPELGDRPCVYVADDEGNDYHFGIFCPSIKYVDSSIDMETAYCLDSLNIIDVQYDPEALVAINEDEYEDESLDEMLGSPKFQQRLVVCIN